MIARNEEKMKAKIKILRETVPVMFDTMHIVADLSTMTTI